MQTLIITDLETTGLEPGHVLEIHMRAVQATDLQEIGEFHRIIRPHPLTDLMDMAEVPLKMHADNGLIVDIVSGKGVTPKEAESAAVEWLTQYHEPAPSKRPALGALMVGNSIANLDVPFLRECMPKILGAMHYRTIDVSSMLTTLAMFGIKIDIPKRPPGRAHRAPEDTAQCLEQLRAIRDQLGPLAALAGEVGR